MRIAPPAEMVTRKLREARFALVRSIVAIGEPVLTTCPNPLKLTLVAADASPAAALTSTSLAPSLEP